MRAKGRSDDWVLLAGAALDARDSLRACTGELQRIVAYTPNPPEARLRLRRVLRAITGTVDGLRFALKARPSRLRRVA